MLWVSKEYKAQFGESSNLWYLLPGGSQEVPRLWHPQRDDRHLEVPEQRLHARRVHQHLPQWQGDRDSLRRCSQEAGQISLSVLHPSHCNPPNAPPIPHHHGDHPPSQHWDWCAHSRERKNSGLLFLLSSSRANAWTLLDHHLLHPPPHLPFSGFYEDLFSWCSIWSPLYHLSSLTAFCFTWCWWMLCGGEALEKQPDMCISAYQCWELHQTTLPDKWPSSWPSLRSHARVNFLLSVLVIK